MHYTDLSLQRCLVPKMDSRGCVGIRMVSVLTIPQDRLSVKAACSYSSISLMEMFSNVIHNIVVAQSDPCLDRASSKCVNQHMQEVT